MPATETAAGSGVKITAPQRDEFAEILTPQALALVAKLHRAFDGRRKELLARRAEVQARLDGGWLPDFLEDTRSIREGDWRVAPIPQDLLDRRVEITGPVDRKMVINALNSGAKVFMADFEDAHSPTWNATLEGQINVRDAIRGVIDYESPEGKKYNLHKHTATLMVRPRGWHLSERHVTVDGQPVSGSLFDFSLYFYHNAQALLNRGTGPYFYLPKLENHQEARLWNDVFVMAQRELGLPVGTIKATVLIETILAAFEMDEILYELRDHIAGLNCGRWDYIFSYIKTLRAKPEYVLPDRSQVVMSKAFLKAYSELLIQTCHKHRAFAMGGMAAFIPNRRDPEVTEKALAAVREDKLREVQYGHDGTWVAHPDLVPTALEVFNQHMPQPNQLHRLREDVQVGQKELLQPHEGTRSEEGLRVNIRVAVQYIEAWLRGNGAVPLYNLMEDAATAEISRTQDWQWLRYRATLTDGRQVTPELLEAALADEMAKLEAALGDAYANGRFDEAVALFKQLVINDELEAFLTIPAYKLVTTSVSVTP